jgi:hypothetical protein
MTKVGHSFVVCKYRELSIITQGIYLLLLMHTASQYSVEYFLGGLDRVIELLSHPW